jgi:mono/diheme cytochrome c family protein
MTTVYRRVAIASALGLALAMTVACGGNPTPPPANAPPAPTNQNTAPPPATPAAAPGRPAALEGAELARATELFEGKCASCHLRSGKGDPHHRKDGIPDFTDAAWQAKTPDEELQASITHGKGKVMPPFKGALSQEEIGLLVAYVRGFPTRPVPANEPEAPMTHGAGKPPAQKAGVAPAKPAAKKPAEGGHEGHHEHPHA